MESSKQKHANRAENRLFNEFSICRKAFGERNKILLTLLDGFIDTFYDRYGFV